MIDLDEAEVFAAHCLITEQWQVYQLITDLINELERLQKVESSSLDGDSYYEGLIRDLKRRVEKLEVTYNQYYELIFAVGMKFGGETRHETALRYIQEAENHDHGVAKESKS